MAGVLERMRRSRKQPVNHGLPLDAIPTKVLELETAKEILAEVLRVRLSESSTIGPSLPELATSPFLDLLFPGFNDSWLIELDSQAISHSFGYITPT